MKMRVLEFRESIDIGGKRESLRVNQSSFLSPVPGIDYGNNSGVRRVEGQVPREGSCVSEGRVPEHYGTRQIWRFGLTTLRCGRSYGRSSTPSSTRRSCVHTPLELITETCDSIVSFHMHTVSFRNH